MPTATDVDNRPVAIGKWPRLRNSHRNSHGLNQHNHHHHANNALRQRHGPVSQNEHRQWCNLENCVHSCDESSNICTDVLLQPELLHELYGIERSKFFIFIKESPLPKGFQVPTAHVSASGLLRPKPFGTFSYLKMIYQLTYFKMILGITF